VIAGAQSSGKSSLLENLTGLPVPITPGIGTRFPIEITLIEDPVYRIKANIVPDQNPRNDSKFDLKKLKAFSKTYNQELTVKQFEDLLREVSSHTLRNESSEFVA